METNSFEYNFRDKLLKKSRMITIDNVVNYISLVDETVFGNINDARIHDYKKLKVLYVESLDDLEKLLKSHNDGKSYELIQKQYKTIGANGLMRNQKSLLNRYYGDIYNLESNTVCDVTDAFITTFILPELFSSYYSVDSEFFVTVDEHELIAMLETFKVALKIDEKRSTSVFKQIFGTVRAISHDVREMGIKQGYKNGFEDGKRAILDELESED